MFEQAAVVEPATPRDPGRKAAAGHTPVAGHKPAFPVETEAAIEHPKDPLPQVLRLAAVVAPGTAVGCLGIAAVVVVAAASSLHTAAVVGAVASAAYRIPGPVPLDSWRREFRTQKRQGHHE